MLMRVSQIIRQKGGRFRIVLDNGLAFPLYRQEMEAYRLEEDCVIPEDVWQEICEEILSKRAKKRALYLLQKQDRTRKELLSRILRDGYPEEIAKQAVESMEAYGYINDRHYAEVYIRYHQEKLSRTMLRRKLEEKGVDRDVIEEALEAEYESDEEQMIRNLLVKRHFDPEKADAKERQKTYAFLMRKGFPQDLIRRMLSS